MIVHKCDTCGKEMMSWFIIKIDIGAKEDWVNIAPLIPERHTQEICVDCYNEKLKGQLRKGEYV
ncbi:MAG: hypothetical protein IJG87_06550 [Ruminococcus sp.]|nr:hypothetical protein [Ruminococcus sp.]